jgi:hypothetical protein
MPLLMESVLVTGTDALVILKVHLIILYSGSGFADLLDLHTLVGV